MMKEPKCKNCGKIIYFDLYLCVFHGDHELSKYHAENTPLSEAPKFLCEYQPKDEAWDKRMEVLEHFRVPLRYLKVKKKASGRLAIKPK